MCVSLEIWDDYYRDHKFDIYPLANDSSSRKGGTPMKSKTPIKAKKTAKKAAKRTVKSTR